MEQFNQVTNLQAQIVIMDTAEGYAQGFWDGAGIMLNHIRLPTMNHAGVAQDLYGQVLRISFSI